MLLKCTTALQGLETNKCNLQVMIKNFLNSYIVFWQLQDLLKSKASENIILSSTLGKHLVLHTRARMTVINQGDMIALDGYRSNF